MRLGQASINCSGRALGGRPATKRAGIEALASGAKACDAAGRHLEGPIMLQVGDVAPDFELLDEEGKPTRLSSFRGKNVVLVFFPAAFSPICTQELKQIASHQGDYQRENASVIGVSVDNKWTLKAFKRDETLNATLLSD